MTRLTRWFTVLSLLTLFLWIDIEATAEPPPGHFSATAETVTDTDTGLVWQRQLSSPERTHADAVSYCNTLELAGESDWRLPEVAELLSIVDETRFEPAVDPAVFPSTPAVAHWTITPTRLTDLSFVVNFADGDTDSRRIDTTATVRCVR